MNMQQPTAEETLFSARLSPHRSLTRANFHLLLWIFCGASFLTTLPFVLLGAWPVAGFMGADILIFWLAFRVSFRSARACETIELTPLELHFAKIGARGQRRDWRFHPAWVKLEREDHEEFGTQRLALMSRGKSVEIGAFLGPDEKAEFATGLSRALGQARGGAR